ncbi:hypothetical protein [Phenylobacterium sp.]|uniref:hypothetical protein n=1 Tax=Phenylobacterium sp. TaxID=1871053 RepID=UPI00120FBFFD|nr:hypothetical protein [Phenylobacterium sp.]THD57482.1 MAG: hypothetical protein E8A49_22860 [Phenylobacterium sp.]
MEELDRCISNAALALRLALAVTERGKRAEFLAMLRTDGASRRAGGFSRFRARGGVALSHGQGRSPPIPTFARPTSAILFGADH